MVSILIKAHHGC